MSRRSHRPALLVALVLAAAASCQSQALSIGAGPPLELDDVEELPPGDAQGDDVSGGYLFVRFDVVRCECRDGSAEVFGCSLPWELGADGLWLEQDDGALTARLIRGSQLDSEFSLAGGIDADGRFEIGGSYDVVDFQSTVGQGYHLARGTVEPMETIAMAWTTRAQFVDAGESFDCDVDADFELVWWPPDEQGECISDDDCHPTAPFCAGGTCTDGAAGGPCGTGLDCASEICVEEVCRDGNAGDPCVLESHCVSGVCGADQTCDAPGSCGDLMPCPDDMPICFEGACQLGVEGDPCDNPLHCDPDYNCVEQQCWDGSEGDPCSAALDCDFDSPNCVEGTCYDGSAGDPCESDVDCDIAGGLGCGASGVCE